MMMFFSQLLANIAVQHYPASRLFGKPKNTAEDDIEEQLKVAVDWKPAPPSPYLEDGTPDPNWTKQSFTQHMVETHIKKLELGSKLKGRVQPLQGI
jgi:hypothetical protein